MVRTPPSAPYSLADLAHIMADLRDPVEGCPWDLAQDSGTIAPYTIEEAYEVADAIARDDMEELKAELGDLLLQVVYHSRLAEERGAFALADVIDSVCAKMIRRHPHVYAASDGRTAAGQVIAWEDQKAAERAGARTLDGVAMALPALQRAQKLQKRAARVGFDWPDADGPRAKIGEELAELAAATTAAERQHELGDLLFSVVNLARHEDVDAEAALRDANARFQQRFEIVEDMAGEQLGAASIEQLERWWAEAKARTA